MIPTVYVDNILIFAHSLKIVVRVVGSEGLNIIVYAYIYLVVLIAVIIGLETGYGADLGEAGEVFDKCADVVCQVERILILITGISSLSGVNICGYLRPAEVYLRVEHLVGIGLGEIHRSVLGHHQFVKLDCQRNIVL